MQRFVVKLSKVTTDKKSCDLASGNIQQTFFFIVSGHYYVFIKGKPLQMPYKFSVRIMLTSFALTKQVYFG